VVCIFGDTRLLALAKPSSGIQPIIMDEVFYLLISRALCLQFHDMFFFHLLLHQFSVVIKGGCKVVAYGIQTTLNVHLDWVVL